MLLSRSRIDRRSSWRATRAGPTAWWPSCIKKSPTDDASCVKSRCGGGWEEWGRGKRAGEQEGMRERRRKNPQRVAQIILPRYRICAYGIDSRFIYDIICRVPRVSCCPRVFSSATSAPRCCHVRGKKSAISPRLGSRCNKRTTSCIMEGMWETERDFWPIGTRNKCRDRLRTTDGGGIMSMSQPSSNLSTLFSPAANLWTEMEEELEQEEE